MAVQDEHPEFAKRKPQWQKIDDACEGEDKIKAADETYLPRLSGQKPGTTGDEDYQAYKKRACFFGATERTATGLSGAILRKSPKIDFPEGKKKALENIGDRGESFDEIIQWTVDKNIAPSRCGLLVDAAEGEGAEPYVARYRATNITNWEEGTVGRNKVPIRVHLREEYEVDAVNQPFRKEKRVRYRVLRLGVPEPLMRRRNDGKEEQAEDLVFTTTEVSQGPIYWQEIWEQKDRESTAEYVLTSRVLPRMNGGRVLHEIPFVFFNPKSTSAAPEKPTLLDLVNVNLSHYRNSADQEHGTHFTALPQPWAAGFHTKKGDTLTIGSGVAWVADSHQATAGYLEFTGAGLGHISSLMEAKQKQMAVLAARILEQQPAHVEAAQTVKLRQAGDYSTLGRTAMSTSEGLTKVLRFYADWLGIGALDQIKVELNTDFELAEIPPETIARMMELVHAGMMSWQTMFWNLKRGEMYPDDRTEEEEADLIMQGPPGGEPPAGADESTQTTTEGPQEEANPKRDPAEVGT